MNQPKRILIVGRSPSVLVETVGILRGKGYATDATNQFDRVLDDYDVTGVDILVFGGMVPLDTKQYLREEISRRNPHAIVVQGLAGIAGLIVAQVEGVTSVDRKNDSEVSYDAARRSIHLTLNEPAQVAVQAWWATSLTPPEPRSTSMRVLDSGFAEGSHTIPLPSRIPMRASYVTVAVDATVHAFTVGAMPTSVTRMVPTSGRSADGLSGGGGLPPVAEVNTGVHGR
ncbi:hypothetical protein BL253_05445 [Pseudofrankia asymbiotica]|uniref:Uncharacterized protein n=2 Tax=Pseudofrankia asymbiotica TaxID=1834516 RepID=A0A1V2IH16_9ACTN|nr:hypothetical protein BL253_05445 [Pseudofrankia asymbiotica]